MAERRFPTEGGVPLSIHEIELPQSRLDLSKEGNFNNHHNSWTRRTMSRTAITQTFRDLSRYQYDMPRDVHRWLHDHLAPPEPPTLTQALEEVEEAYDLGETMKVYLIDQKKYIEVGISRRHMEKLYEEYHRLGG